MNRIAIDVFFTYAAMPLALAGAFTLWAAWKVTEKMNYGMQKAQAAESRTVSSR